MYDDYFYSWGRGAKKKAGRKAARQPGQRVKYGQTWWGEQWLNALNHIDFDNRLPRGRAYASNGSVRDFRILNNRIEGEVQGSRRYPYDISIEVPLFSQTQKEKLLLAINNNPFLISQLLNRQLPQELHLLAHDQEIRLFPSSWKDLKMECSCPDWAVPCKHLAAVIYLLANEIDANPFLVLQLHGLNLIEELKNNGLEVDQHAREEIPAVENMIVPEVPEAESASGFGLSELPDFSKIPEQTDAILSLLTPKPLFFPKDFRTILHSAYKSLAGSMHKQEPEALPERVQSFMEHIDFFEDTMILLDLDLKVEDVVFTAEDGNEEKEERISFSDLVLALEHMEPARLSRCSDALQGIALHRQFAVALAARGAIIPHMLTNKNGEMIIRWIPAMNDAGLREITSAIQPFANPGTIWIWHQGKRKKEQYFPVNPEENSLMLTSLFITFYMDAYACAERFMDRYGNRIIELFFRKKPALFDELSDKEVPNTIQLWLKRLQLANKQWIPILRIEEQNNWYYLDFLVLNQETRLESPVSLHKLLTDDHYADIRFELLRDLSGLSDILPDISLYIQSKGKQPIQFNPIGFTDVFIRILPMIRLLGIELMMPKELEKLISPKPSLRLSLTSKEKSISFLNLDQLLGFEYQVALGDTLLPADEFRKLVRRLSGIVKIRDQYVLITESGLQKLFNELERPAKLTSTELLKSALTEEYHGAKVLLTTEVRKLISRLAPTNRIVLPEALTASLRPYQLKGYRWMAQNSSIGFGSLIADDMGLGKTVQVIATLLKFKKEGLLKKEPALVVVPTTLLTNWMKEIGKFAPSLKAFIYHGAGRNLETKQVDLVITTYGMIRSDREKFKKKPWYAVVIDEAQNIKNPGTDQTKSVKSLKAAVRIAMSGTPVENRLSEYWSIMDFVNPGYLGPAKAFEQEFATPIGLYHDKEKAELFRKITSPFILRRLKTDKTIISDLPDKIENNHYCSLVKDQAALYQNVLDSALEEIEQVEGIHRRGLVLKMITALKQICNHPENYTKKGKADPSLSGKSQLLLELLDQIHDAGEKTLIFTQYKEMGDILVRMVADRFGASPLFLHGGTQRNQRDALVEEFQEHRNRWIFILSLKAGGTGLNLTAAGHVIHHDLWWNPAVEAQATDRAYRIGQTKNVMVNRLLVQGTFEEKIDDMLKSKKALANLTVASGENWIGELSNHELKEIFRLG